MRSTTVTPRYSALREWLEPIGGYSPGLLVFLDNLRLAAIRRPTRMSTNAPKAPGISPGTPPLPDTEQPPEEDVEGEGIGAT